MELLEFKLKKAREENDQLEMRINNQQHQLHEDLKSCSEGTEILDKYQESGNLITAIKDILTKKNKVIKVYGECFKMMSTSVRQLVDVFCLKYPEFESAKRQLDQPVIDQQWKIQLVTEETCRVVVTDSKHVLQYNDDAHHLEPIIRAMKEDLDYLQQFLHEELISFPEVSEILEVQFSDQEQTIKMVAESKYYREVENKNRVLESKNMSQKTENEILVDREESLSHQIKTKEFEISSLKQTLSSLEDKVVQYQKNEHKLSNELSELEKKNRKLTFEISDVAIELNKAREESELKQAFMEKEFRHQFESLERTLTHCLKQLEVKELGNKTLEPSNISTEMTDQLKIMLDVNLTINDKIDKFISAYPGCLPSHIPVVQNIPDDVKEYCMKLQNRVGANINDFARHLGLDPLVVDKLTDETKDFREAFWKVVCRCCIDIKEQFNMDTLRKAAAEIGIHEVADMRKEHQVILSKHHSFLVEHMMVTITLIYFKDSGLLSDATFFYVLDHPTEGEKADILLRLLPMMGDTAFEKFVKALKESGQGHLANRLWSDGNTQDLTFAKEQADDDFETVSKSSSNQYNQNRHLQSTHLPTMTSHIPTGAAVSGIATKDDIKQMEEHLKLLIIERSKHLSICHLCTKTLA